MESPKGILFFDLDGTLLRDDKTLSRYTLEVVSKCKEKGLLIGISTSRGELNCLKFLGELKPDILISSGGALVRADGK
ncbi:MAG: HAD family hydrolase, partial [Lachnospiraceae bacterium]|nr:HAD family hydrolase [Lachnospiraceae bacterium]